MKVASRQFGFTLIEMLVVISILGLLAALVVPALKNLGASNINTSATTQLLGDVGYARQLAIANRTTVYMVFVPTNFWLPPYTSSSTWTNSLTPAQMTAAVNLCDKQLTGYAFMAYGAAGDQPGNHQWYYLAPWRSLPQGTFIASWKFMPPVQSITINNSAFSQGSATIYGLNTYAVPFPTVDSPLVTLPCIVFNYLGQMTNHEYIPLARGSVQPALNPVTRAYQFSPASISETPAGNSTNSSLDVVEIDPLTGRGTLRFQSVQ